MAARHGVVETSELSPVSNDGKAAIETALPYVASITIEGVAPILFHRWSVESVEAKANAAKGSRAKKQDDIASYLWKDEEGRICLPSEYLRQSIIHASKYRQDPRSPRKSLMDLMKAALVGLRELHPFVRNGSKEFYSEPDFIDKRRVVVQRNGITRARPALHQGWKAEVDLLVNLPEYVTPTMLNEVTQAAGRLIGLGDFRPSYGRFVVSGFKVLVEKV